MKSYSPHNCKGCLFGDIEFVYHCGASTAKMIVRETCQLIWNHLKAVCIPEPTEDSWRNIASGFQQYCNFPNCLGTIDGKHIRIIQPLDSGSLYYNFKNYFSMVLLAVCDSNYMFTFVDVGSYGKASDSIIYKESELFKKIETNSLNIPPPQEITVMGTARPVNYYFIGDEAFGLSEHMLRPYSGKHLDVAKRIFNYRLSRARRCIECAFGILSNKWRILHRPLNTSVLFAEDIVKACRMLHNFVLSPRWLQFPRYFTRTWFQRYCKHSNAQLTINRYSGHIKRLLHKRGSYTLARKQNVILPVSTYALTSPLRWWICKMNKNIL